MMRLFPGIFAILLFLCSPAKAQKFLLSKAAFLPLDNARTLDISEDGHYALMSDSRSFIIVYDLYAGESLFIIESSLDKNWLRNTRAVLEIFDKSDAGTISISKLIQEINRRFTQNDGQKPSLRSYNPSSDWIIW